MKKIIFVSLILILFIFSYSANAQNDSVDKTVSIKVNPVQMALGEFAIITEFLFSKKYSVDIKTGYNFYGLTRNDPNKGPTFQIGLKKYYKAFSIKKRRVCHYTGLWLLYRNLSNNYNEYYSAGTIKALMGSETFYDNFILDFYFGFGLRLILISDNYHYEDTGQEFIPTIHLGMNIGFNIPIKKQQ